MNTPLSLTQEQKDELIYAIKRDYNSKKISTKIAIAFHLLSEEDFEHLEGLFLKEHEKEFLNFIESNHDIEQLYINQKVEEQC